MNRLPVLSFFVCLLVLVSSCAGSQAAATQPAPASDPADPLGAADPDVRPEGPPCTPTPDVPVTDIYLVDMEFDGAGFEFGAPVNLTDQACYDNQPFFLPDSTGLLYASNRNGQTDIYRYVLADGTIHRVTDTPESEYSPTATPDGQGFTVVRVEADGTQRLWQFPLPSGSPSLLLPDTEPVGYHAWGFESTLGLFLLGEPPTLHVANARTGETRQVVSDIGRSLNKIPVQRAFSFVNRAAPEGWEIQRYDVPTGTISPITPTLEGREFHTWMPDGTTVLMADGSALYAWEPAGKQWTRIADFGIAGITRLAVSPDARYLAFVAERAE